jgi:rod shape-determining protein MreC
LLRLFRSKWFIVSLITIILLVVMGVSANKYSKLNWLNNIISVPLTPVQSFFTSIGRSVGNGLSYFKDVDAVKKENERLKAEVSDLNTKNRELEAFQTKNEELRQALNLKGQFGDYTTLGANIIAIDPDNWFNVFKVDIGSREGVQIDSPVLTSGKGLVGRVLSTDLTSSEVLTIIDEESAVSCWISKAGGGHAIVRGDMALKEKGLCKMDYIPLEVDVEVGDVIETSGVEGGIYPKGIVIGEVIEVRKTNSDMDRYAIIQPAADFKRLEEVYVLKSNEIQETGNVKK